jgi:hypothetical protein
VDCAQYRAHRRHLDLVGVELLVQLGFVVSVPMALLPQQPLARAQQKKDAPEKRHELLPNGPQPF